VKLKDYSTTAPEFYRLMYVDELQQLTESNLITKNSVKLELGGGVVAAMINGYAVGGANGADEIVNEYTITNDCGAKNEMTKMLVRSTEC